MSSSQYGQTGFQFGQNGLQQQTDPQFGQFQGASQQQSGSPFASDLKFGQSGSQYEQAGSPSSQSGPVFLEVTQVVIENFEIQPPAQQPPRIDGNLIRETVMNVQSGATFDLNDTRREAAPILFPAGNPAAAEEDEEESLSESDESYESVDDEEEEQLLQQTTVSQPSTEQLDEASQAKYGLETAALQARIEQLASERSSFSEKSQAEILERDRKIEALKAERTKWNQSNEGEIQERDLKIQELSLQIEQLEQQSSSAQQLQGQLQERDSTISRLNLEIQQLQERLSTLSTTNTLAANQTSTLLPAAPAMIVAPVQGAAVHQTLHGPAFNMMRVVEQHELLPSQAQAVQAEALGATGRRGHRHGRHGHESREERKARKQQERLAAGNTGRTGSGRHGHETREERKARKELERQQNGGKHHHFGRKNKQTDTILENTATGSTTGYSNLPAYNATSGLGSTTTTTGYTGNTLGNDLSSKAVPLPATQQSSAF